ncbi:serine/threonine-protein kinase [Streptomyces sp. H39-S7]|uniref:serine/threonine-protein kinase n=1 Tax=Streptomyces sp. H39-S7 TaxID=3004357 RepID=UPI0022AF46A3|nr:serine/threonine-protein kinase [Streptomyces sp. H39-S7]MCZ4119355.1 serine/threonine-protein kinase [Streptomyces sp. H39-S7]
MSFESAGDIGVGTVLNGRYRLEVALGGGGFGQVYSACDQALGRQVAVKVLTLRPEWADGERSARQGRFRREATAAARLSHPNVAAVHDAGEHSGAPFIVMELLRGQDLRQVLAERGALPVAEVVAYGIQICAGLEHAHGQGLVHRDIKPENLMLLPRGIVKICDFGLVAERGANVTRYTGPMSMLGSPPYFSPEQALGHEVTGQADLYALGCVLYALLAAAPPFSAGNTVGYAYLHVHEAPEQLITRRPGVPAAVAEVVHALLAKDPADRPAGAAETAERLRAALRPAPSRRLPEPAKAPRQDLPRTPTVLDRRPQDITAWSRLEEAERLLAAGRFPDADRCYWNLYQQLSRSGGESEPAAFAALFGRARVLEGLNGPATVVRRLTDLSARTAAALGPDHPLARCVTSYAAVRTPPVR